MPDFTIESGWWCASNEQWSMEIPSSTGKGSYIVSWGLTPDGPYQYGWHCNCPGFMFRHGRHGERTCKHIAIAEAKRCKWNAEMTPGIEPAPGPSCPDCGGEVRAFRVAV